MQQTGDEETQNYWAEVVILIYSCITPSSRN